MRVLVAILGALLLAGCGPGMYGINGSYNHKTGRAEIGFTWSPGAQPDNDRSEREDANAAPPLPSPGMREDHGRTSP